MQQQYRSEWFHSEFHLYVSGEVEEYEKQLFIVQLIDLSSNRY
jgi:hypothetical protein